MKQAFHLLSFLLIHLSSRSQSLVFADQFGGNDTQSTLSIAADHSENIYAGVVFYDEVDIDPGPGVEELEAEGNADVALVKLNSSGELTAIVRTRSASKEEVTSKSSKK